MDQDLSAENALQYFFSKTSQGGKTRLPMYSRLIPELLEKSRFCLCFLKSDLTFSHVDSTFNDWYGDPGMRKCHEIFNQSADSCPNCPIKDPGIKEQNFINVFKGTENAGRRFVCWRFSKDKEAALAVLGLEASNGHQKPTAKPYERSSLPTIRDCNEIQDLEKKIALLEETNNTLRTMLKKAEEQRVEFEKQVQSNIQYLITPCLEKLANSNLDDTSLKQVEMLFENHKSIVSPFTLHLQTAFKKLTPSEIQIADLIRRGKSTREIAAIRDQSRRTVEFHRDNIRKKLGLKKQKMNLRAFLLSLE